MGETLPEIFEAIQSGKFAFGSPDWDAISNNAKDFISKLLVVNPTKRMTADDAMKHPWLSVCLCF